MNRYHTHRLTPALILAAAVGTASGGQIDTALVPPPAAASSWEFRAKPYGWLTALSGTTGVGPITADVDGSVGDILGALKMAAALQFEARNGHWGVIVDGFYADLGTSGSTPGAIYDKANIDLKQFIGELDVAYRVHDSPNGFVDLYVGMRYNNLSLNLDATLDVPGIQAVSENASANIVNGITQSAEAVIQPKIEEFKAATAAKRAEIEDELSAAIKAEAGDRIQQGLKQRLAQIRSDGDFDLQDVALGRINSAVTAQRLELARSTAELAVARIRAAADASLQGKIAEAQAQVQQAEQNLSDAVSTQLQSQLPTHASANKRWLDPVIGIRAQWNINGKWFLAGKSDVGGFGLGSDLACTLQGTLGYQFTNQISAELGYRYLYTDYSDDTFSYDLAEQGMFIGLNIAF